MTSDDQETQDRITELEAQLSRVIRERDRWAAKFGRLQAAALELKVEASDSEEELGADAWDPETHDFRQERPGG